MRNKPHSNLHKLVTNHLPFRKKNNGNKNNKLYLTKMKEDVGTLKHKKHANKIGRLM